MNGAIGERRCNFGKVGQWGGPVQHVHRIGEWGGPIGQRGKWWTEGNSTVDRSVCWEGGLVLRTGYGWALRPRTNPAATDKVIGLAEHVVRELLKSSSLTDITLLSFLALDFCNLGYPIERGSFCLRSPCAMASFHYWTSEL